VLVFCSATVAANRITPPLQYAGIVEDYRSTFAKAKTMKCRYPPRPAPGILRPATEEREKRKRTKSQNFFVDPAAIRALHRAAGGRVRDNAEAAHRSGQGAQ
jgi:metallo-beta-lactamase class B